MGSLSYANKSMFEGSVEDWGLYSNTSVESGYDDCRGDFLAKLSIKVANAGADKTAIMNNVRRLLGSDEWPDGMVAQRIEIAALVDTACREALAPPKPLLEQVQDMQEEAARLRDAAPASKEGMLQHINADIALLQKIFAQDVVKAIDLERAFNGVLNNNIEVLTQAVEDKQLDDWALGNIWKIYYSEYEYVEQAQKEIVIRQKIIDGIKAGLTELQDEDTSA